MLDDAGWLLREDIEQRWRALIAGKTSREDVHEWAIPWVEGSAGDGPSPDLMVGGALQTLHGFTMACFTETPNLIHHGPPGVWVKSEADIRSEFDRWQAKCAEYDADPEGYRQRVLAKAREAVAAEKRRRAQQA